MLAIPLLILWSNPNSYKPSQIDLFDFKREQLYYKGNDFQLHNNSNGKADVNVFKIYANRANLL